MDNNGETDNLKFVCGEEICRIDCAFHGESDEEKERTSLSNTRMVFEKCLPEDACYKFDLFDQTGDGICCDTGRGYYRVFWDGA